MSERLGPIHTLVTRRDTIASVLSERRETLSRIGVVGKAAIVPKPLFEDPSHGNAKVLLRVGRARELVSDSIMRMEEELVGTDSVLAESGLAYLQELSEQRRQLAALLDHVEEGRLPEAKSGIAVFEACVDRFASAPERIPALKEGILMSDAHTEKVREQEQFVLPDGKIMRGNRAKLMNMLAKRTDAGGTLASKEIDEEIYMDVVGDKALISGRRQDLTSETNMFIRKYYGWAIVNTNPRVRGNASSEGRYKLDWVSPRDMQAINVYLEGGDLEAIAEVLTPDVAVEDADKTVIGTALLGIVTNIFERGQSNKSKGSEAEIFTRLSTTDKDTRLRHIREEFDIEDLPELIELPPDISLSPREQVLFGLLQRSSSRRVVPTAQLLTIVPPEVIDRKNSLVKAVSDLRKKFEPAGIMVPYVDEVVSGDRIFSGYYLVKKEPHREIPRAVPKAELVLPPEEEASFGTLSRVDVALLAGAVKHRRAFLRAVFEQAGSAPLVDTSLLTHLSDLAGDTPLLPIDTPESAREEILRGIRGRAFDKLAEHVRADDFTEFVRTVAGQDATVAAFFAMFVGRERLRLKVRGDATLSLKQELAALRYMITDPSVLRDGVIVDKGNREATITAVNGDVTVTERTP